MRERLSSTEHNRLASFCRQHKNIKAVLKRVELSPNTLHKRLLNPNANWKSIEKKALLDLISPSDRDRLCVQLAEKLRTEIEGRILCPEQSKLALGKIRDSAEQSGMLLTPQADAFVAASLVRSVKLATEFQHSRMEPEIEALAKSLSGDTLQIALPCIELMPCAVLGMMLERMCKLAHIEVDFTSPNGSELADKLRHASLKIPDILITGVSAFTLNKGIIVKGSAELDAYELFFPIHSIRQQCYSLNAPSLWQANRIFFVPGGCTQHLVQEKSRRMRKKFLECPITNDVYLHNQLKTDPQDVVVAYPPIGDRFWRERGLVPVGGSEHTIYLSCFVTREFSRRRHSAADAFGRLFRLIYRSLVRNPEAVADRLMSDSAFVAAYTRATGFGNIFAPNR